MKYGLSHRDSATHEYCNGCFLDYGTDEPSPGLGPLGALSSKDFILCGEALAC
jgi:hypothetical protein